MGGSNGHSSSWAYGRRGLDFTFKVHGLYFVTLGCRSIIGPLSRMGTAFEGVVKKQLERRKSREKEQVIVRGCLSNCFKTIRAGYT